MKEQASTAPGTTSLHQNASRRTVLKGFAGAAALAGAGQSAGADGDAGLVGVVADAGRVELRVHNPTTEATTVSLPGRRGWLGGVVVCGGEPCVQEGLRDFLRGRRAHLEHDVGHRPQPRAIRHDLGPARTVGFVADLRRIEIEVGPQLRGVLDFGCGVGDLAAVDRDAQRHPQISPLVDIRDRARVASIFQEIEPDVVFHAAAHKHVSILEEHPCEAIRTNVIGTSNVVDVCIRGLRDRIDRPFGRQSVQTVRGVGYRLEP